MTIAAPPTSIQFHGHEVDSEVDSEVLADDVGLGALLDEAADGDSRMRAGVAAEYGEGDGLASLSPESGGASSGLGPPLPLLVAVAPFAEFRSGATFGTGRTVIGGSGRGRGSGGLTVMVVGAPIGGGRGAIGRGACTGLTCPIAIEPKPRTRRIVSTGRILPNGFPYLVV